ncbi:MAG: hypothetical protein ACE37F_29120 [Nannocystaceae bacterium]|nr:hypothetical protein [bacterium]
MRRLVATSLFLCGCHAVPADSAGAYGEQRWVAADESFGVEFLSPPWSMASEDPERLELEVPPEFFGVTLDGSSPSHAFQAGHVDLLEGLDEFTSNDEEGDTDTDGDTDTETDGIDPGDFDVDGLPDALVGVDLRDPYAVARAELDVLIERQGAQLDHGVSAFVMPTGVSAVEFQVQLDPGFFVRAFYIDARPTLVRATFVSLFDLDTEDVSSMARTIDTVDPGRR